MDIFISYRRRDSASFAARLRDRLEHVFHGQVFLDVAGIDAGDDYADKLASTVRGSKAVIAVIGPNWARSGDGAKCLGEAGDFVTEEIAAAIEADIALLPVLIEGTRMPAAEELPARLQPLARRHGIVITHAHFESDAGHLIAALYKPLGIAPPSRIERILEALGGKAFDQRARNQSALVSLAAAAIAAALMISFHFGNSELADILEPLAAGAFALVAGIVGRHSLRRRWAALAGIALASATLIAALPLFASRSAQMLREPWLEAARIAQVHAQASELAPSTIFWTARAPFAAPPPTVECGCLAIEESPPATRPLPQSAQLGLRNRCAGWVTFVVTRSSAEQFTGMYPWWAQAGREFAIIALVPGQGTRVPLAGAYEFALLPWICLGQAPRKP